MTAGRRDSPEWPTVTDAVEPTSGGPSATWHFGLDLLWTWQPGLKAALSYLVIRRCSTAASLV